LKNFSIICCEKLVGGWESFCFMYCVPQSKCLTLAKELKMSEKVDKMYKERKEK
jgi:hypothetical protein